MTEAPGQTVHSNKKRMKNIFVRLQIESGMRAVQKENHNWGRKTQETSYPMFSNLPFREFASEMWLEHNQWLSPTLSFSPKKNVLLTTNTFVQKIYTESTPKCLQTVTVYKNKLTPENLPAVTA